MIATALPAVGTLNKTTNEKNIQTLSRGIEWNFTYSGGEFDDICHIEQTTPDGGYLLTGFTEFSSTAAALWMVKTNGAGAKEWQQIFDGLAWEYTYGMRCFQTSEGGYIMCGNTWSYGAGNADVWVIKTDASGTEMGNRTYGSNA